MEAPSIASVISFCSLDERFLPYVVESVKPFSKQIIISVCDHRFCGTPEDNSRFFKAVSDCTFVEYAFSKNRLYGTDCFIDPNDPLYMHHWHNTSRLVGYYFVDPGVDWLLFLDADEIIDHKRFSDCEWNEDAYRLAAYRYFREPSFVADRWEDTALLVQKKHVKPDILLHPKERGGMASAFNAKKMTTGVDGTPLVHHYSWVRTKQEMLDKVNCWAHGYENNWELLIEEEMDKPFSGKDFVYGDLYQQVEPFIDPFKEKAFTAGKPSKVHRVDATQIYNLEIQRCFLTPTPI